MKNFVIAFLLVFNSCFVFGQTYSSPVEYNNVLTDIMNDVTVKNIKYVQATVHEGPKLIENRRLVMVQELHSAKSKLSELPGYNGDTDFRDACLETIDVLINLFDVKYKEAVSLQRNRFDSYQDMEAYLNKLGESEQVVSSSVTKVKTAQLAFADKHGAKLEIGDNDLGVQLKHMKALNKYSRAIFLDYFRVFKENEIIWDMMNGEELDAAQLNAQREQIIAASNTSLANLATYDDFNGNVEFRQSCTDLINFYKGFAEDDYKTMIDVMTSNERTQEDVDTYNNSITNYNNGNSKVVAVFNKTYQALLQSNVARK